MSNLCTGVLLEEASSTAQQLTVIKSQKDFIDLTLEIDHTVFPYFF